MLKRKIPLPTLRRIPRYLRVAEELFEQKVVNISSAELANHLGYTASQVRQDFSALREIYGVTVCGQQGCGYRTEILRNTMSQILRLEEEKSCIIVGADYLVLTLAKNFDFSLCGAKLEAIFADPEAELGSSVASVAGNTPVMQLRQLETFCEKNHPRIAILACEQDAAQILTDKLAELGIEGVWNMTNTDILAPEGVEVEDLNVYDSLIALGARLKSTAN